jgi:hypothetical protein
MQTNRILPSQQVEQHTQWGVDPGEELPEDSTNTFPHLNLDQHDIEVQENEGNNEVSPQITNRPNLRNQLQFPGHGQYPQHRRVIKQSP